MYTVLELSKMLDVSRNTIYERLKTDELQEFIVKDDKGTKLQKEGLNVLCALLGNIKVNKEEQPLEQVPDKYVELLESTVKELKDRCATLEQDLRNANKSLAEISYNVTETNRILQLESLEAKKHRGIFSFFK